MKNPLSRHISLMKDLPWCLIQLPSWYIRENRHINPMKDLPWCLIQLTFWISVEESMKGFNTLTSKSQVQIFTTFVSAISKVFAYYNQRKLQDVKDSLSSTDSPRLLPMPTQDTTAMLIMDLLNWLEDQEPQEIRCFKQRRKTSPEMELILPLLMSKELWTLLEDMSHEGEEYQSRRAQDSNFKGKTNEGSAVVW